MTSPPAAWRHVITCSSPALSWLTMISSSVRLELRSARRRCRAAKPHSPYNVRHLPSSRRNRSCSASNSAYSHAYLRSVVCPSVVWHIRALWLNISTDLDAVRQVHLWGPTTHWVYAVPDPQRKGRFGVEPAAKTRNCKLQANRRSYAAT